MTRTHDRRQFLRSGALAGVALLAGCSAGGGDGGDATTTGTTAGTTTTSGGGEAPTAALSVPSLEFTFFARMENAFERAKADGVIAGSSTFYDAQNSQSKQVSDVETAITNDVDFLLISAITAEGVVSAVRQANEAGIPVVAIDRNVAEGDTVSYVASDNVRLGERSTTLCLDFMKAKGQMDAYNVVQLEGTPGASVTNDRGRGFSNVVDGTDELNALASQTGEFSTQTALRVMEDFVTQYGDRIHGVFCQNDLMALGAHQALRNANMSVPVTGIDGTEAWVKLFADHQYYGTVAQLPEEMVNTAIETGKAHLAGETVEDYYPIEGLEVTRDNADSYLSQYFG